MEGRVGEPVSEDPASPADPNTACKGEDMASKPKLRLGKNGLTASETLALFDDLPDGAALAAASETWGDDYSDFIAALAEDSE